MQQLHRHSGSVTTTTAVTVARPGTVGDVPMVDEYVEALDAARDVALEHLATLPERRVTDRELR